MSKYIVLSSITNRTTETDTTRAGAEFLAAEAGVDIRDLHWQDRHSSMETERNWELSGRDGLVGSIHEIDDGAISQIQHAPVSAAAIAADDGSGNCPTCQLGGVTLERARVEAPSWYTALLTVAGLPTPADPRQCCTDCRQMIGAGLDPAAIIAPDHAVYRARILVWVETRRPVQRGPQHLGWRPGSRHVARRADLTGLDPTGSAVYGTGPGTWHGVYHGRVPVVLDEATPVPAGARAWDLWQGRPCAPAPELAPGWEDRTVDAARTAGVLMPTA